MSCLSRLHLVTPATSALSERICIRAAIILTLKRAHLKEELVARVILPCGNSKCLSNHYVRLVKIERNAHFHDLIECELEHLPSLHRCNEEDKIDASQDYYLLDF